MCLDWEIPASTKAGMVPVLGQHMLLSTLPTACWAQCCCLHFSSPSYEVRGTYFEAVSCLRFCGQQMHSPAGRIWFWSYFSMNLPAVSLGGWRGGKHFQPWLLFCWSCSKSKASRIHSTPCFLDTKMSREGQVNCSKVVVVLEGFLSFTIIQVLLSVSHLSSFSLDYPIGLLHYLERCLCYLKSNWAIRCCLTELTAAGNHEDERSVWGGGERGRNVED